jgi:hypothetical protein
MTNHKVSAIQAAVLVLGTFILAAGFILFYTNLPLFERYVQEDGVVEWITVAALLSGSIVCLTRFRNLFNKRNRWFLLVIFCLGIFLFFSAGEEISWGQRILGIKSPGYFEQNNAQRETNLHNLIVGGVKLNKLIFSLLLVIGLAFYLAVVPVLYHKIGTVKRSVDALGLPVPRVYQVAGFLLLILLTALIPHGKNAELLECVGALLFFLIMLDPKNKQIFQTQR